jgi:DNA-binding GntR family transcriptional regulator
LKELSEFREEVEGLIVAKAAKMAKKEDIEQLKSLLESFANNLQFGKNRWNEIAKADRMFHLSLARITGNRIYESILFTVYDNINRYFQRFLPKDIMIFENTYAELCDITKAIAKRDANKAKTLLQEHIRKYSHLRKVKKEIRGR